MEPYEGVSAECSLCGGEIYRGEDYYAVNGRAICRDCLADYAAQIGATYYAKDAMATVRVAEEVFK